MFTRILSRANTLTLRLAVSVTYLAVTILFLVCLQVRLTTAASAPVQRFEGFHDGADCGHIFGWAWDANDPYNAILVDVYSDNVLVGSTVANQFRQDLANVGKGDGNHAFDMPTPTSLMDGVSHSIRVKIGGTNIDLGNTPRVINCAGPAYEGFHDSADCNGIAGWAWDKKQPNATINVDVYVDNDNFSSIVAPANQFRQDLLNVGKGNGFHAFAFSTPSFLKDGHPHSLRVRISNTLVDLGNTPRTINCSSNPGPAWEGYHDGADCNSIFGWLWDSNRPNTVVSVDIYSDNKLIATVAADQFRQDLANAGKGNGFHAFNFPTPASLKDGQTHTILVAVHNTDIPLGNTFRMITCP